MSVSSEISDLYCLSVILLLRIKNSLAITFLMCVVQTRTFMVRCLLPTTNYSTGMTVATKKYWTWSYVSIIFRFLTLTRHTCLNTKP